ncbi:outer membrane beta-barrel protein [Croceivirga thetidis]|uniref:PorT family protein n=1 Tax=Croceivirga thetidis TaxID=2721623 RepID=A0ABX1GPQ3_9FLAO|nr:outer membrane beta-barrel protein [Croceivirga thetidis]NKI31895.1 PorT family protein [Croceivirga thetidis]
MKKLFFLIGFCLIANGLTAQSPIKFGVTGGLLNSDANIDLSLGSIVELASIDAVNETGFYIGLISDIEVAESFHVQPELTYGSAGDLSFVYFPIMAKYYLIANKLNVQLGPQLTFSSNLDDIKNAIQDIEGVLGTNGNIDDVLNTFGVDIGFGAGLDITDKLSVQARYALELSDRYSGPLGNSLDIRGATLNVGIAYFF